MTAASFEVDVPATAMQSFAELSGDWNPLHTDAAYAASTEFHQPVLHGAYSAGLVSRMAGMHLPGVECLLHGMSLRFNAPILPPARLRVTGEVLHDDGTAGRVAVTISDAASGQRYTEATYDYGRHVRRSAPPPAASSDASGGDDRPRYFVTGAAGGLGRAVLARLGDDAIGISRSPRAGMLHVPDPDRIAESVGDLRTRGIIHCAWPAPDNGRLVASPDAAAAVEHHLASPVRQVMALARLLIDSGEPEAMLVLVGSTFAQPGRHNYRMPLYSLGKSLIPELARILALELGAHERRCTAVVYDVLDGGMNERISARARLAAQDRSPRGRIATPDEAADQIVWLLHNSSFLVAGATLQLSGGALP